MGKSNQQKIKVLLGFVLVLGLASLSQGLPYSALAAKKASAAKRQDLSYDSPSSAETSPTPDSSDQANAYTSDATASDPQSSSTSSSDQYSSYASSSDQPSLYTTSDQQPSDSSQQGRYDSQATSSYAGGSEQQSTSPDQSNYNTTDQSVASQPSQTADWQRDTADNSNYNTTDQYTTSQQSQSADWQRNSADNSNYDTTDQSVTSQTSQTPDWQRNTAVNSNSGAEQAALDQSQAAQFGQNETQSTQSAQDQSQAAQYTPDQTQTSDNSSQTQTSSYYTGADQASRVTSQNNESQSSPYSSTSQPNDEMQNNDTYAAQGSQNAYQTGTTSYPASPQSDDVSTGTYSQPPRNTTNNSRYEVVNVTSNIVPNPQYEPYSYQGNNDSSPATVHIPSSSLSALGLPGNDSARYNALLRQGDNNSSSPVYLSPSDAATIPENAAVDSTRKFPSISKETTVTGNHATTYLELPEHLHKPAIVKYDVQIEPKIKGEPIEQEIAIMPPARTKVQRKPLVLLKQSVTKPTEERIQIIVPKEDSALVNTPKVEVKGGHVDKEDLNKASEMDQNGAQSETTNQSEGQAQFQGQSQVGVQEQAEAQDFVCRDLPLCSHYNPSICDQTWMKRHCKKMCGLCSSDETSSLPSPNNDNPSAKHCEYGGVIHQSGETWSPGPCVPKCQCMNGFANCSKVECPDLNCATPMKRRWKCCPECLPNHENETRCGVDTRGGNGEGLCCVFPFNYRGVDYYTCTTTDASEPWCSVTRNYDRDGLWGTCVVKSKVENNRTRQSDSNEKSALVLAAQLTGARKWRNSSNNQVSDLLKALPSPLSQNAGNSLNASELTVAYKDGSAASQNLHATYKEKSNSSDHYSSDGINSWNSNDETSRYGTQNVSNRDVSETSSVTQIGGLGNLISTYASNSSETFQENSTSLPTSSSTTYDQRQVSGPAAFDASANSSTSSTSNPYLDQNAGQQWEAVNTNRTSSEAAASYSDSQSLNAKDSRYGSYSEESSRPGETSYTDNYPQDSTVADSSDNVVPNGIENQTSYEMNPDASTAQYGNNQAPAT